MTVPPPPTLSKQSKLKNGFALIATISIMVLLVLIALAMLTTSSIELRSTSVAQETETARANARLALMVALGELQSGMGPDQRVSASSYDSSTSGTSSEPQPQLYGGWRSWEGDEPGNYDTEKSNRFLGWMVSHPDPSELMNESLADNIPDDDSVVTLFSSNEKLGRAWLVDVNGSQGQGKMAWIVDGENVKARTNLASQFPADGPAAGIVDKHYGTSASELNGFKAISDEWSEFAVGEEQALKAVTLSSLELANPDLDEAALSGAADYTTQHSAGLLVNVNKGGFKQDLSLLFESEELPPELLMQENEDLELEDVTVAPQAVTWRYLKDFYEQYKQHTYPGGNTFRTTPHTPGRHQGEQFTHQVRRSPVIARIQWLFSYSSVKESDTVYKAALVLCPVVTLWNPYNTEITSDSWAIEVNRLPFVVQPQIDGIGLNWTTMEEMGRIGGSGRRGDTPGGALIIDSNLTFKPGETRVFSPLDNTPINNDGTLVLSPGFRNTSGWRSILIDKGNEVTAGPNSMLSFGFRPWAIGDGDVDSEEVAALQIDALMGGLPWNPGWVWAMRLHLDRAKLNDFVDSVLHDVTPNLSLASVETQPAIFASANYQLKTVRDGRFPSKGVTQTNITQAHTQVIASQPSAFHPVNSIYDLRTYGHTDWTDSLLPNVDSRNRGFVGSGFTADGGVPSAVYIESPVKPMQSLIEFQHADIRGNNGSPPYGSNYVGNSIASPLFGYDADRDNLHIDYSYHINNTLFDDYFFSSIAPRDTTWTNTPSESAAEVYGQHIDGSRRLPNSRYTAIGDTSEDDIQGDEAYKSIASKLLVEGMFNVNSTSVEAWIAMLTTLNKSNYLFYDALSDDHVIRETSGDDDTYIISRFSIAAGGSADNDAPNTDQIPEELYLRGYRSISRDQIRRLAEGIVEQVKLRGPFLSMAEFINRRKEASPEFSKRGAIAEALAEDPEDSNKHDINQVIRDFSTRITEEDVVEYNYPNPSAAEGYSGYGVPGWVTQADVLRPIAPYITVRDDTFRIVAYGSATDSSGRVLAEARCEVFVQRYPEYLNSSNLVDNDPDNGNAPEEAPFLADGGVNPAFDQEINGKFGRKFRITSFRWLSPNE